MTNINEFGYSKMATTSICLETPSKHNPFVAESVDLYGYDLLDLTENKSFIEVLLLINTGQLPDKNCTELMNALMVAFINPGPRNPAVRAAMTAGISKTKTPHLLPIGLMVLSGESNGASHIESSMKFIQKNMNVSPFEFYTKNKEQITDDNINQHLGLGLTFGSIDIMTTKLALFLATLNSKNGAFKWLSELLNLIKDEKTGWLPIGLISATLLDLGIAPREGAAIFQLICSPGIIAHALEQTHKPVTSMPFLEDSQYVYKQQTKK